MLTPEVIGAFFATSVLLGLAPGPDNLFVLSQSALHGRCAGLSVMLGLCTGLLVHTAAVALGVAVIFQTSALAFSLLKYAGAAYLAWLAWGALRAPASTLPPGSTPAVSRWKLYRRGILMNVTNPKVSVFFLAFLPQFADPARGSVTVQMLLLGGLFIAATVLVFGAIALLAGTLGQWLARSARAQVILNRLAGLVFLGLALKLATAER
ncbi:LysE family translocator [Pseudodesulfovibrio indicus]|uniref:LysE family translocator n=1 Tax=Pseudodesulfovibrio indicus TaxID=1716143 RepID=UPI0029319E6A|nr:LysE family translocator [Pseudodesulfovibrio indicus]